MNNSTSRAEFEKLTRLLKLVQQIALVASQAQSARAAFRRAIQIICDHQDWTTGHVYLRDESGRDALVSSGAWHCVEEGGYEPLRRATVGSRIEAGRDLAWAVVESGQALWIEDLADEPDWPRAETAKGLVAGAMFPIRIGHHVVGVMEFYSTRPIQRHEAFLEMMDNFGIQLGHVIERSRLERRIADASEAEQRQLGQELHDTLGQQITAVTMLARGLQSRLEDRGATESEDAVRLVEQLERAKRQVGNLVRGLIPTEIGAAELADSLASLAARSTSLYDVDCRFEGTAGIVAVDDSAAMQLYRIAQEAVHNAVKHGDAATILVRLEPDPDSDWGTLIVRDDGVGFEPETENLESGGMGLRIMRHRANLIDGDLEVESSAEGTTVRCSFPRQRESAD